MKNNPYSCCEKCNFDLLDSYNFCPDCGEKVSLNRKMRKKFQEKVEQVNWRFARWFLVPCLILCLTLPILGIVFEKDTIVKFVGSAFFGVITFCFLAAMIFYNFIWSKQVLKIARKELGLQ